jgi:hypothetical protein
MFRCLVSALCLAVLAACHDGMSVSRRDGAVDGAAAGAGDAPHAFDLVSARDEGTDSVLGDGPREAAAPDVRDANVSEGVRDASVGEASRPDAELDIPSVGDAAPADASPQTDLPWSAVDAPRPDVASLDAGLASFCTGNVARLATNGHVTGPAIRPTTLAMDCCEGFELEIITATFLYGIYVRWIVPASAGGFPLDIDLSAPSSLRSFDVRTDCDSTRGNCSDVYDSGFVGRLQLSRTDGGYGYDGSLCVHAEEPADSPHPHLHSFDLYVPRMAFR